MLSAEEARQIRMPYDAKTRSSVRCRAARLPDRVRVFRERAHDREQQSRRREVERVVSSTEPGKGLVHPQ